MFKPRYVYAYNPKTGRKILDKMVMPDCEKQIVECYNQNKKLRKSLLRVSAKLGMYEETEKIKKERSISRKLQAQKRKDEFVKVAKKAEKLVHDKQTGARLDPLEVVIRELEELEKMKKLEVEMKKKGKKSRSKSVEKVVVINNIQNLVRKKK